MACVAPTASITGGRSSAWGEVSYLGVKGAEPSLAPPPGCCRCWMCTGGVGRYGSFACGGSWLAPPSGGFWRAVKRHHLACPPAHQ